MTGPEKPVHPALFDGQRRYFLSLVSPTLVGRLACAILLSGEGIAAQHAKFIPDRAGFTVEPVGGEVQVNGKLIAVATILVPGDVIKLGSIQLTYAGPVLSSNPESALNHDQLFEKVKNSVVGINANSGAGSGVFVDKDVIVSNRHVVGYEREVEVHLADGSQIKGRVIRSFPEIDIAFIRAAYALAFVPKLAASISYRVGQSVLVIGNPMGLSGTMTRGIISAVNRDIAGIIYLQTDAAINPGNSGCPIFDEVGEVIGIATMMVRQSQGLNFAIPSDQVRRKLDIFFSEEAGVQRGQGVYCNICGYFGFGGVYCPNCGANLEDENASKNAQPLSLPQCKNCGKVLNPGDQFCSSCGTKI